MKISGEFEIKLSPLEMSLQGQNGINLGRMAIDKTFFGDLAATSKGEMLSARTSVDGSAGYVAIEQVVGTLSGKTGGFVLQHFGTMQAKNSRLILEVVPDSATAELEGLSGKMEIIIKDGKHFYNFDYKLGI
ncbi:MAG TPA: DUF3224 domain-containing protein [Trueperaceae bacterium]|nr:DUF3224 domain-containing protein [Trueperaceae bacterium]